MLFSADAWPGVADGSITITESLDVEYRLSRRGQAVLHDALP